MPNDRPFSPRRSVAKFLVRLAYTDFAYMPVKTARCARLLITNRIQPGQD